MSMTAFLRGALVAHGSEAEVAAVLRAMPALPRADDLLVFDDETGRQLDLDLREEAPRPRGRPALGVSAREVTLLPRHWDWLATQRGGASAALRRLVDEARGRGRAWPERRDAAYRFLSVAAGDRPGFEEAARALYANDPARFAELAADWPEDLCRHAEAMAWGAGEGA